MLLPVTSIFVWCARRPEMAENMERSMEGELLGCRFAGRRCRKEGQDADVEPDDEVDDEVDDGAGAVVEISVMRPSATATPPTIACASLVSVASRTEDTTPDFFAPSSSV